MKTAAAATVAACAGAHSAPPLTPAHTPFRSLAGARCWAEALVARREAARRFLAGRGLTPFLLNRDAQLPPNRWHVQGYLGDFLDHDLIALAEQLGMEAGHGA